MHYSQFLLHLDLSYTDFTFESLITVAKKGLRKSRTLLAVHLDGISLSDQETIELKLALNECKKETMLTLDID